MAAGTEGPPPRLHRSFCAVVLAAMLGCSLAGCGQISDDPDVWYNKTVFENVSGRRSDTSLETSNPGPSPNFSAPGAAYSAPVATATAPPAVTKAGVMESDLYRSEASCGGATLGGASAGAAATSISLEMTECEVVRRIGSPDKIELTPNPVGDRLLVMNYARGDRPRLYRFANGRLMGMEALTPQRAPRAARVARPATSAPRQ
jgi:hypothetical protein